MAKCKKCGKDMGDKFGYCEDCTNPVTVAVLLASKKSVSHVLHGILTIVTFGLWGIIWLIVFAHVSQHNNQIDDKIRAIELAAISN